MSASEDSRAGVARLWPWLGPMAFLVAVVVVRPAGEFAVNDDFSYAWTARNWVATGELELHDWTSMSLLVHAAWGALWSMLVGVSHTALRLSTVALASVGLLGVYGIARELGLPRPKAALVSVVSAFCPLHFGLSLTYMTDVPFLAWMVVGLWAALRWSRTDERWCWALAVVATLAATLTRQLGLALGLGVLLTTLRGPRRGWGMVPLVVSAAALAVWLGSLHAADAVPELMHTREADLRRAWEAGLATPVAAVERTCLALLYAGLLGAPLLVLAPLRRPRGWELGVAFVGTIACGVTLWRVGRWMPALPHWFRTDGIGPTRLLGGDELSSGGAVGPAIALTAVAVLGVAVLLPALVRAWCERPRTRLPLLVLSAYLAPIAVTAVFDRYLLLTTSLLPIVALAAWNSDERLPTRRLVSACLLLVPAFLVSVLGTQRLLDWNRAAWEEAEQLVDDGVPREHIDAGVAWNGWWLSSELPADRPRTSRSWWWVGDDRYAISFTPLPGYTILRRRDLGSPRWGPPALFVLRRDDH